MSNDKVPFYAQAAVLDRYIHSPDPGADPDALEVIVEVLRSRPDIRDYFFRSGPSPAWASILWERGFFKTPPSPQETEAGYALPRWDVQEYLISVASQVPDIVIKHVESVQGHDGWYIGRAIRALCFIPAEKAKGALPKVIEWIEEPKIALVIAQQAFELMESLAKGGESAAALDLFEALTAPLAPSSVTKTGPYIFGGEAVSRLGRARGEDHVLAAGLELLGQEHAPRLVSILEEHLCTALNLEADATERPDREFTSWWRSAIEDTNQDMSLDYKAKLLRTLRDALETWVQQDARAVKPRLERYLSEERKILRRLGLHLLCRFSEEFQSYVTSELQNTENLDDVDIHHEFFMLLQHGYPHLNSSDQEALVAAICKGPPRESTEEMAGWAERERGVDREEYIQRHTKAWVRDRLWMLREYLEGQPAEKLQELVDALGAPEHPAFLSWSSGAHWVREVSPSTEQEIAELPPEDLVVFVKEWQPAPGLRPGPERISHKGRATVVAKVMVDNLDRYVGHLVPVALQRPEYAFALLEEFREGESGKLAPWEVSIALCEQLLADETVRQNMDRGLDGSWVNVRRSMVRLLEVGVRNPERAIPVECLPRVRDILLLLTDDPDPMPADDQPSKGWFGYKDPATIAINHVRPNALFVLIEYARVNARLAQEATSDIEPAGPGPQRLELVVREKLTDKLDRRADPSWAVHSVFGRCLPLLHWLDHEWVKSHLDDIFPEADDEANTRFFVAAWDSFVIFNHVYLDLLELLHAKYERAIFNLSKGYVTQTHLQPQKGLATHVLWEYMRSEYSLSSPSGQQSLVVSFFLQAPPEARGNAAWALWRIVSGNPSEIATYWPRARSLWEWRMREVSQAGHSADFDEEMQWFSRLPLVAPDSETLTSMWPLLEGLLPHITRHEQRSVGWESIEDYLAREVDRDPVKAIEFYRLMHDQETVRPRWFYSRDEARTILETAAAHPDSREEALSLIDLLARRGVHDYRDIYERYTG